jgi:hypothetical protein
VLSCKHLLCLLLDEGLLLFCEAEALQCALIWDFLRPHSLLGRLQAAECCSMGSLQV